MANFFEDEVIKFVAAKRPLKIVFLLIAAIGVLGSAYTTLEPLIDRAKPLAYRLLDVSMDPATKERLGCAYFSGAAQWDLPRADRASRSYGAEAAMLNIRRYENRLSECMSLFGASVPTGWYPNSQQAAELDRAEKVVSETLYGLSGTVQGKDRLSYLVFRLGSDASFVEDKIAPQSPEERSSMLALVPDPIEAELAKHLRENIREARSICLCRFPDVQIAAATRGEVLESAQKVDREMTKLLNLSPF